MPFHIADLKTKAVADEQAHLKRNTHLWFKFEVYVDSRHRQPKHLQKPEKLEAKIMVEWFKKTAKKYLDPATAKGTIYASMVDLWHSDRVWRQHRIANAPCAIAKKVTLI